VRSWVGARGRVRILRRITACQAFVDQEETVEKAKGGEAREIVYWRTQQESLGYVGIIFMAVRDYRGEWSLASRSPQELVVQQRRWQTAISDGTQQHSANADRCF